MSVSMHPLSRSPCLILGFLLIMSAKASEALKIAILTGSTRLAGPPRPILGPRVAKFLETSIADRNHEVITTVDPRQLPLLEKPQFAYSPSQVPADLQELHDLLIQADDYVAITPEFNHAPSPGLLNTLNHFGSSVFGFKPSVIVSYSPSQWGGTRAAHSLRPILSELGCIPVSSMIHFPKAHQVLEEDGSISAAEDKDQWQKYVTRGLSQLEWWAEAAQQQRLRRDPYDGSPVMNQKPDQRNAPS